MTREISEPPENTTPVEAEAPLAGRFRPVLIWLVAVIALILTGWALRATAVVSVPFLAALFVALAVAPVDGWTRRYMPRRLKWVGHVTAMAVVLLILAAFFAGAYLAAQQAVSQMPNVTEQLGAALPGAVGPGAAAGDEDADEAQRGTGRESISAGPAQTAPGASSPAGVREAGGAGGSQPGGPGLSAGVLFDRFAAYLADHATEYARAILTALTALIAGLVLVFFLVLLMLVEAETWRAKAGNALSGRSQAGWEDTLAVLARSFRWFVLVRTGLGAVTATLYVLWLGIFGVNLLVVWWVLALLLNFIPTLGSIVAGVLPVIYVLVTRDWTTALFVAAGLLVIEQVMGNYVDPWVQGKQLSVSPLVTFFALLLFGWMWGVVGALLAVPIAVAIVIACAHTPSLKPIALLLSDCKDMQGLEEITKR